MNETENIRAITNFLFIRDEMILWTTDMEQMMKQGIFMKGIFFYEKFCL